MAYVSAYLVDKELAGLEELGQQGREVSILAETDESDGKGLDVGLRGARPLGWLKGLKGTGDN